MSVWRKGVLTVGLALWALGALVALDRQFPPDLSRFEDRSVTVTDARGRILRAFLSSDDKWRLHASTADIDARYLEMLKAYEDKRFDRHPGIDPLALIRAFGQFAVSRRIVSGASTLTMQTARLLEPHPRTIGAKLVEMARAVQLEARLSKREILEIYLTLAPYGGNLEGVRAASLSYFGKEPHALTLAEAALLVALPQSPESVRPDRHPEAARTAVVKVLHRLTDEGLLSVSEVAEAAVDPLPTTRRAFPFLAPRLAQRLNDDQDREVIATTIDADVQERLQKLVKDEADWSTDGVQIAMVVVDNASRRIIAYLGGSDFWAEGGQIDLAASARSPGSALKPFIYGLAFDDLLIHPETLIDDRPMVFGGYAPRNFARTYQGTISIRQALRQSLNVPAVALLDAVGPIRLASILSEHGAHLQFASETIAPSLPVALGGVGITLYDLTQAYTALANAGEYVPLTVNPSASSPPPRALLGKAAAWYVTDILRGTPMPGGWAARFGIKRERDIAFKTGTSYGFRDAWAVGYSPTYTVGVWVGRADGTVRPGHFGLNTAAPVLLQAFSLLPPETRDFPPKPENVLSVQSREQLPSALRRFTPDRRHVGAQDRTRLRSEPPVIKFPPDGTSVALPETSEELALSAVGGKAPLRWMVNGHLLPAAGILEPTLWTPDGLGFADISVIDAEGRSAHSHIRLIPARNIWITDLN